MQEPSVLVLEILRQDNALKMSVYEQGEIALTLRHYSQCEVSFTEIDRLCQESVAILKRITKNSPHDSYKDLAKTGQLLWGHLLSRQAKDKLKSAKNQDLILCVDEELISIPWEILYDGNSFLCLKFNLGRLVRTKSEVSPVQYRSFPGILRMLVLANPTNDLKSAYLEGVNIKNQFDRKRDNVHIDFKSTHIEKMFVKKNICDYDIVHFAGHCEYEPQDPKNSGWVLSDGRLTVNDILGMCSTVSLPSLLFSNACHSARADSNLMDQDYQEKIYSLASAFLFSGVRHYIGSIRKIEDPVSLAFAREFYAQLIAGKSVGECVRLGRLSLINEYGIAALHWTNYLLYGDPSFVLFRAKAKEKARRPKINISLNKKQFVGLSLSAVIIIICIMLYAWLPTLNPNTYWLFTKSKGLFQKGSNQAVIQLSLRIINEDPLFLPVYPLLAETYQRTGDNESALGYYFDYARQSERRNDKKSLTSAYIAIGWFYHLQDEFVKALEFYNKAIILSRENNDKLNEAIAMRKLAVWHIDKNEYDKALELLTKSSEINRERQFIFEHKYNLACDYFDIGLLFADKDDFATAKEFYNKSFALFEKMKLKNQLSDYYFNLGEIYLFEKEYQKALDYYLKGLELDTIHDNKPSLASDYNMIGELYVDMDDLKMAEDYFKQAISICQEIDAKSEMASVNYNLGLLYKKKNQKNRAREYLRNAQEFYRKTDFSTHQEIQVELLSLD